jgi:hypothetical protein
VPKSARDRPSMAKSEKEQPADHVINHCLRCVRGFSNLAIEVIFTGRSNVAKDLPLSVGKAWLDFSFDRCFSDGLRVRNSLRIAPLA